MAQKKAKEDKKKKEQLKQAKRARGEDTFNDDDEESGEEWPANVANEPDWYALEREDQEGSSQLPASESAGLFSGASGSLRHHAVEEASRGPAIAVHPSVAPQGTSPASHPPLLESVEGQKWPRPDKERAGPRGPPPKRPRVNT